MFNKNSEKGLRLLLTALFALIIISVSASNALSDQITIDIPPVEVTVIKDANGYASFSGEGIQYLSQTGEPALPYQVVKTLVPPGADLSTIEVSVKRSTVESNPVESQDAWEVRPTPVPTVNQDEPVLNQQGQNEEIYATNARFPSTLFHNVSTGNLWGWQLVDIPIALFQYNPVSKSLYRLDANQAVITFEHKSFLVPRLRLGTHTQRLCLESCHL
ncbi:C25 family peptidase propeptide domain-containing protein [Desulfonema magnum]|uniref:Propeptide domain-containing protein n=1 Tax=Desulfonema magnum TaxID=45655 RepID=A0A975BXE1_9BACT|nr:C25 family peptidase propeptide domain-containing protein [Desulfonema magnum]QTA93302.1 Propeptide domain-containing protein [Desulfonema magnum]